MRSFRLSSILMMLIFVTLFLAAGCNSDKESPKQLDMTEAAIELTTIQTPYCDLKYPAKWDGAVTTNSETDDGITFIQFVGEVNGNKSILFEIYFGEIDAVQIGTLKTPNGVAVPVSYDFFPLKTDGWSQEDADTLCAMQEDINVIIDNLKKLDNYSSAY